MRRPCPGSEYNRVSGPIIFSHLPPPLAAEKGGKKKKKKKGKGERGKPVGGKKRREAERSLDTNFTPCWPGTPSGKKKEGRGEEGRESIDVPD